MITDKRAKLMLFIVSFGLFISGVTIWPAISELKISLSIMESIGMNQTHLFGFITKVRDSLILIEKKHPHIIYAYDWLAFAHIVLAILFYGAAKDPVRNRWVIECGLVMCALIPILAGICIPLREIPLYWILFDCAFVPGAAIPLAIALRDVAKIEKA